jgi:HEAT repeat protein
VWALASNGTADAKRLIERALQSKDSSVKVAAISSLGQNPDDHSTDVLINLLRDQDSQVRTMALSTLGQIGSERAQQAILNATRSGSPEERIAAISGLAQIDDAQASRQLASLMRDSNIDVARTAIASSYNGGPEVDQTLTQILNDPSAQDDLKTAAASQLRVRGTDLDDRTEQLVTKLAGPASGYGGYGYGNYRYYPGDVVE